MKRRFLRISHSVSYFQARLIFKLVSEQVAPHETHILQQVEVYI